MVIEVPSDSTKHHDRIVKGRGRFHAQHDATLPFTRERATCVAQDDATLPLTREPGTCVAQGDATLPLGRERVSCVAQGDATLPLTREPGTCVAYAPTTATDRASVEAVVLVDLFQAQDGLVVSERLTEVVCLFR